MGILHPPCHVQALINPWAVIWGNSSRFLRSLVRIPLLFISDHHQERHRASTFAVSLCLLPVHVLGWLRPHGGATQGQPLVLGRPQGWGLPRRPEWLGCFSVQPHQGGVRHRERGVHGALLRRRPLYRGLRTQIGRTGIWGWLGWKAAAGQITSRQVSRRWH